MCKIHGKWVERKELRKWGSDRGGVLVKADILHGSHRRIFWRARSLRLVPALAALREKGAGRYEKRIRMQ